VDYYHILCVLNYSTNNASNYGYYNHHQKQNLYSIIDKYISEGYLVIYAAEYNTPIHSVIQNMIQNGIRADNLIKDTSLIITNTNIIYSIDKSTNAKMILEGLNSFIFNLRKNESLMKSKIVTITTAEEFFERGKDSLYLDYERLLANNNKIINRAGFNSVLFEGICCYNTSLIEKLSFADLIHLLNAHSYTIHKGGIYKEWCRQKVLNLVHRGVIKAMGDITEKIMFKVLEIVFNTKEDSIIMKPDVFETRVRKMVGEKVADIVFSCILTVIMKEITFNYDTV
jgi:hypothetical protein